MKKIFYFITISLLLGIESCSDNIEETLNNSTEVIEEVYTDGTAEETENLLKYWKEQKELYKEMREWHQKYPDDTTREVEFMNKLKDLQKKYNID